MDTPINTSVPIDLHPDSLLHHSEALHEGEIGAAAYVEARDTLAEIYTWLSSVEETGAAFRSTLKEEQRKLRTYPVGMTKKVVHGHEDDVYEAASKGAERALSRASVYMTRIHTHNRTLDKALDKATDFAERKTPEGIALGAEIRRHVLGLSNAERAPFLQDAIATGQMQVVAAVLRAPSFLSGLTHEQALPFQRMIEQRAAPKEYAQRSALQEMIPKLEKAIAHVPMKLGELERAIKAAGSARRHANKQLNALRSGTVVAK